MLSVNQDKQLLNQNVQAFLALERIDYGTDMLWVGADVGRFLDYKDSHKAIQNHVDSRNKTTIAELLETINTNNESKEENGMDKNSIQSESLLASLNQKDKKTVLLYESGIYQLMQHSKKTIAKELYAIVANDILPSIRKTGSYTLPSQQVQQQSEQPLMDIQNEVKQLKPVNSIVITNEKELHEKVVEWVRSHYPNLIIVSPNTIAQDTEDKRLEAYKHGYVKGSPDVLLLHKTNKYAGLVIEFKHPVTKKVKVSDAQLKVLNELNREGYLVVVSNSYEDIIFGIYKYMKN